jgi:hypothetical protein
MLPTREVLSRGIRAILQAQTSRRRRLAAFALASLLGLFVQMPATAIAAPQTTPGATPSAPLVVNENSHILVLEYEAWFGPNAVTFQPSAAKPFLQSADMQSVGGGYDSADPAVIQQHVAWIEDMGFDAAISDLTNNVSCIFNSAWFIQKYLPNCTQAARLQNQSIRNNTGNLFPAWSALGTPLKLIPLLDGADPDVLYVDLDGKTSFEKEINYFGARMREFPDLTVIYEGKPLMLIFLGAAQDPNAADNPLWLQIREFLKNNPEIAGQYTFKMMAGYLDAQPGLWATQGVPAAPVAINPEYGFWSWVDRLNTTCTTRTCPYYPSYNEITTQTGSRVENFTASIATAGIESGWGCPHPDFLPYCSDDSLRYAADGSYATFHFFMSFARQLDPIFLIVHQFNEFDPPDEGFDANTDDDIEPANLWGTGALSAVKSEIQAYRSSISSATAPNP